MAGEARDPAGFRRRFPTGVPQKDTDIDVDSPEKMFPDKDNGPMGIMQIDA